MKKIFLLLCFYSSLINICSANDIITLDLNNPSSPQEFIVDPQKGHWVETYNTSEQFRRIEFDLFSFTHIPTGFGGNDVGEGMSYWDGFTYCTSGDITDYGQLGSSDGWISQQWGCMAGGGIKTDGEGNILTGDNGKVLVEKGMPYLVAYWGYWIEKNQYGDPCLQVNFTDSKPYEPMGVYICNHPWPYYGNIHGDGFASPFTEEGQYFKLIVHGINEYGEDIGITIDHMLAEFKDGELHQSPEWEWIDLSALGAVHGIYFTMESTDIHSIEELGPNTAVYFCMDKLQVRPIPESTAPSRPNGLKGIPTETTIDFSWNPSTGTIGVKGYNLYLDGEFIRFLENTQYTFTGLFPYVEYRIGIEAIAMDDSLSEKAFVTIRTTDETPPTAPENLTGETTEFTMNLSWDASSDNVGVTEYHIYLNGERQKRVFVTNCELKGMDPGTTYFVEVEARDAAGNRSERAYITMVTKENGTGIDWADTISINIHSGRMSDILYVEVPEQTIVEIYTFQGMKILSEKVFAGMNLIDISHLSRAIYIIKCNQISKSIIK